MSKLTKRGSLRTSGASGLPRKKGWALAAIAVLALGLAACQPTPGAPQLVAPQTLFANNVLMSPDKSYTLTMKSDGDLVLTMPNTGIVAHPPRVLWQTNTSGEPGAKLTMWNTGDLQLAAADGTLLWHTNTAGHPGAKLVVLDTGDLEVQATDGTVLWSAGSTNDRLVGDDILAPGGVGCGGCITSTNGQYLMKVGLDGNLQLWATGGAMLWSTAPNGIAGLGVQMCTCGNFALIDKIGAYWVSPVSAGAGGYLEVLNTGQLALQTASGTTVWSAP